MARSAVLLYNPGAGHQRDRFHSINRMVDALRQHGIDSTERHRFARYLAAAFTGSHVSMPGVTYLKAPRAVAHGPDNRLVHVDGELLGRLPVSFDCVPDALSLVVPVKPPP